MTTPDLQARVLAKIVRKKQEGCEVLPNCHECPSCVLAKALKGVVEAETVDEYLDETEFYEGFRKGQIAMLEWIIKKIAEQLGVSDE